VRKLPEKRPLQERKGLDDDVKMEKMLTSKRAVVTHTHAYIVASNVLGNSGLQGRKMDCRIKVPHERTIT
jgi:hypothetical protein